MKRLVVCGLAGWTLVVWAFSQIAAFQHVFVAANWEQQQYFLHEVPGRMKGHELPHPTNDGSGHFSYYDLLYFAEASNNFILAETSRWVGKLEIVCSIAGLFGLLLFGCAAYGLSRKPVKGRVDGKEQSPIKVAKEGDEASV